MIVPFKPEVSKDVLDDLKSRLSLTRWPDEVENSGWKFGTGLDYMKELIEYWTHNYDWRDAEARLNSYPNFMATVDGYKIHFLHIQGKGKKRLPLIITHGWPYSVFEMMKLIPLLTEDTGISFDLVIPSLMGFGFSQKVRHEGCNVFFMADLWLKLMRMLGYDRFVVQGGDFGAGVSSVLALKHPDHVMGMHLNYIPGNYRPRLAPGEKFTPEELEYLRSEDEWYFREGGYSLQQRTRPLTLSYAMNDSPAGLCAWIVEKMQGWSDCQGNVENIFTKNDLLENVTLYWITETFHSSARLYYENSKAPIEIDSRYRIRVPAAIARFRFEEPFPPRRYIERGYNISNWSDFPSGGHFPAMEQPKVLSDDIRKVFSSLV